MRWKLPPKIKIYEALGSIADKRIQFDSSDTNHAKVYSSSGDKCYDVEYDEGKNAIVSNDNASYWQHYLGYPSIAMLLLKGRLKYNPESSEALKGIKWKDINKRFKNDYSRTEEYVLGIMENKGADKKLLIKDADEIMGQLKNLGIEVLGKGRRPP